MERKCAGMAVTMEEALSTVEELFTSNNYHYNLDTGKNVFNCQFNLSKTKLGSVRITILVQPDNQDPTLCRRISSYGNASVKADSSNMAEVCEFLTRANFGLAIGNFELDYRDGEIRYKVCLDCQDAMPGHAALEHLLGVPVAMFNRYGDGLLTVIMGMTTPENAIKKVDG